MNWKTRSREPEILDQRRLTAAELETTHRFLAFFNRFGGGRAIGREFRRLARSWTGPIRILDVGSGGGDIGRAIASWATRARLDVAITGVDLSADALAWARRHSRGIPSITFVQGDGHRLPLADRSVDYVICNLFLHHLDDDDVVAILREFDRVAARGLVLCDVIRRRRAWLWARFVTLFGSAIVRNDGPLSVRRSFTLREIDALRERAGLSWARIRPVLGHHFLLSGERPEVRLQSPR